MDGISALVAGLRGITATKGPTSIYETRGVLTI